jgi:hypothetical protein
LCLDRQTRPPPATRHGGDLDGRGFEHFSTSVEVPIVSPNMGTSQG